MRLGEDGVEQREWEVGGMAGSMAAAGRGGGGGGGGVWEEEGAGAGRKNAEPHHALPQHAMGHGLTPSN